MKRFVIRDSEAGNRIDYFDTFEEAFEMLKQYEEEDKKEETYTENFYEIYDLINEKIVDEWDYRRDTNLIFGKNGNGYVTTKITIPVTWAKELGFTEDDRKAKIQFKNNSIVIEKL